MYVNTLVPPPGVSVSIDTGRFISENTVTLHCIVTLPSTVNSRETVITTWFGPSGQLTNSSDVTISNANGLLQGSSIAIANFVPADDNGEYICNATVIPSSSYILGNSATTRRMVMISG